MSPGPSSARVGDELQETAVRVAEVDAHPLASSSETGNRASFDRNVMRFEMGLRLLNRTRPDETEIAVAWPYRERRNIARDIYPWSVHIQLRIAQAKRDPRWCP